jgi:hypothetical protein
MTDDPRARPRLEAEWRVLIALRSGAGIERRCDTRREAVELAARMLDTANVRSAVVQKRLVTEWAPLVPTAGARVADRR